MMKKNEENTPENDLYKCIVCKWDTNQIFVCTEITKAIIRCLKTFCGLYKSCWMADKCQPKFNHFNFDEPFNLTTCIPSEIQGHFYPLFRFPLFNKQGLGSCYYIKTEQV